MSAGTGPPRRITGLVLAAGSSSRLGRPKQLLPFEGGTLLDAVLDVARAGPFSERLVTVGAAAAAIAEQVDTGGFAVVDSVQHTEGCSSSIVAALGAVDPASEGIVMLLGDQPGVTQAAIAALIDVVARADFPPLAVCRYRDGIGHPFWFGRELFEDLAGLHGDKAVWKLIESGRYVVVEVPIDEPTPLDVDTWDDYEALLAAGRSRRDGRVTT